MDRFSRTSTRFRPQAEAVEPRLLLNATRVAGSGVLRQPGGSEHPVRPNTPVLPYGAPSRLATFLDPSSRILLGDRISVGGKTYVAPFAGIDATAGFVRVGESSALLDNAVLVANPAQSGGPIGVEIGDQTLVQYGARIEGPSTVGGFAGAAQPTSIGANAVIRDAVIQPGAIVGAGATVVGVTVPSGLRVLPGATVSTQAEATDPALGKVVPASASDVTAVRAILNESSALAAGYANLYQGMADTGPAGSPVAATTTPGLFNGNLARVRGTSAQPLTTGVTRRLRPKFLTRKGKPLAAGFADFPARVIGVVTVQERPVQFQAHVGKNVSIRADENQQIRLGKVDHLGSNSTIRASRTGPLTIGRGLRTGEGSVITGGPGASIGQDVQIGARSVVESSRLGSNVVIGEGAIVQNSTLPDGAVVPAGAVLINGVRR